MAARREHQRRHRRVQELKVLPWQRPQVADADRANQAAVRSSDAHGGVVVAPHGDEDVQRRLGGGNRLRCCLYEEAM